LAVHELLLRGFCEGGCHEQKKGDRVSWGKSDQRGRAPREGFRTSNQGDEGDEKKENRTLDTPPPSASGAEVKKVAIATPGQGEVVKLGVYKEKKRTGTNSIQGEDLRIRT